MRLAGDGGRRRVGIKDVAEAAGVSITTVSHALSGKGRLTDETRERVRRIATELGYTPHPVAQDLASGRTGMIATVVSLPFLEWRLLRREVVVRREELRLRG